MVNYLCFGYFLLFFFYYSGLHRTAPLPRTSASTSPGYPQITSPSVAYGRVRGMAAGVLQHQRPPRPGADPGPGEAAEPVMAVAAAQRDQPRAVEPRVEQARHLLQPQPARLLRRRARAGQA